MPILKTILSSLLCILLLGCGATVLYAQASPLREYQVKAVFLYNFTQFVEWPDSAYTMTDEPLVIGILGKDPFGAYLDEVVAGEEVNGHPLQVQRFEQVDDLGSCHLLFISKEKKAQLTEVMQALKTRSVLTVSDEDGFMHQGGMVKFITVNNKIRLQINPEAAKAAGLHISSRLLSLAEIITLEKRNN